jgi:hypothetical protein
MKRLRAPSPALVIAFLALFVALGGVTYAAATIGSDDIINGSIRNRDFKDGTLRGQEAKRNGFGGGAIKESTLAKVDNAAVADGVSRHAVVNADGTLARGRGTTSSAKSAAGQYQVVFDGVVTDCAVSATLADPATGAPPSGEVAAGLVASNANAVEVATRDSAGVAGDRPFHLILSC